MTDTNTNIKEITTIVEDAIKHHEAVKEDHTLGETFYKAGLGLGLIRDALQIFPTQQPTPAQVQPSAEASNTQPSTEAADALPSTEAADDQPSADTLLSNCRKDAILLNNLYLKISQESPTTRLESYKDFLRENGSHNLVETLVLNLMQNLCRLAKYYGIEEGPLEGLRDAITELKSMKSSDPNIQTKGMHSFLNNGSGTQFNATTLGTQNNSTGNGTSFVGSSFHAPVTFGGKI